MSTQVNGFGELLVKTTESWKSLGMQADRTLTVQKTPVFGGPSKPIRIELTEVITDDGKVSESSLFLNLSVEDTQVLTAHLARLTGGVQ